MTRCYEALTVELMKVRRSCQMVWIIVEGMESSGQMVGLLDKNLQDLFCKKGSNELRRLRG